MTTYPQQSTSGRSPTHTSGKAIAALVFGIIGICGPCPFGVIAIVLGIMALRQIKREYGLDGRGLAIAGIVLPLAGLPVSLGMTAAIAIPNFIRFQARSKQTECRANLTALLAAERAFHDEHSRYSSSPVEVGFQPERRNRYAYFLAAEGALEDRSTSAARPDERATGIGVDTFAYPQARALSLGDVPWPPGREVRLGVEGRCPECSFTAICAGNVDNDEDLDVWSISTVARAGANGEAIPEGQPYNDVSDLGFSAPAPGSPPRGASSPDRRTGDSREAEAPRVAASARSEQDRETLSWTSLSADGRMMLVQAGDLRGECEARCAPSDGGPPLWEAQRCFGARLDLRFVSNDCERVVVLHPLPRAGGIPQKTEVGAVYDRDRLKYAINAGAAVRDWSKVRSAGTSFYWLAGALDMPGQPPRYSPDGLSVEMETVDGRKHSIPLTSGR